MPPQALLGVLLALPVSELFSLTFFWDLGEIVPEIALKRSMTDAGENKRVLQCF